jgi:putative membrane protein
MDPKFKLYFSIFLIWLFSVSGMIGIQTDGYTDWFLSATPLNLFLSFTILVVNTKEFKPAYVIAFFIPFALGFITEALGVNYGLIFGTYEYGKNLGYKVWGVPIMICFNWALLTAITADIASYFTRSIWVKSFIGAALMTGLDVIIEVSAPRFDFWEFEGGIVPLQNYVGWLAIAFLAHLGYQYFKVKTNRKVSLHLFFSMLIFFSVFLFV